MNILISGGAGDIGIFISSRLIEEGHKICIVDRVKPSLRDANKPDRITFSLKNISDDDDIRDLINELEESNFIPDAIIHCVGKIHNEPLVRLSADDNRVHSWETWKEVISANLDSVFLSTRRIVDLWLNSRKKGIIIAISSVSADGNAGQTAYSAAKAGINSMIKVWAKELGPLGIRSVAISPGFIDTESTKRSLSDTRLKKLQNIIPLRKLGEKESVYNAVKFALENEYVNGCKIPVDGGITL